MSSTIRTLGFRMKFIDGDEKYTWTEEDQVVILREISRIVRELDSKK